MRKTFLKIILVSISLLLIQCKSDEKAINKELTEMAANLNVSTSIMPDQYTRIDNAAVSDDNVFSYNYTVLNSLNPDSLVELVSKNLKENIEREFSTNPQLLFFKENSVVINYIYKDESSRVIRSIRINPEDYQ